MPNAARKKQQYECAAKEFELTREAMRALNIEADFKGLPLFETWSRYTERRQDTVITDNRRHNKNRIARAKAAGPLRPPRPRLAALKPGPRCATARTPDHHSRC